MIVRRVLFFVLYGVILLFCLATGSQVLYFVLAAMTGMRWSLRRPKPARRAAFRSS